MVPSNSPVVADSGTGCNCKGNDCGCCATVNILGQQSACVNITWQPEDPLNVSVSLTVDGATILNDTINQGRPVICVNYSSCQLCLDFTRLDIISTGACGCVDLSIKVSVAAGTLTILTKSAVCCPGKD